MKVADIVINAAAISGIDTTIKKPTHIMRVNMHFTANVLEVAKNNWIKDRFIDFSTSGVFGKSVFKLDKSDETISATTCEAR